MKSLNVTRIVMRVNTLVFLALMALFVRRRAQRVQRTVALGLAASVALQYLLPLVLDLAMLGSVRVDRFSNKLETGVDIDRRSGYPIFRAKYNDPESFQDYVFVYDPTDVHFDSYSVNYTRRARKFNSSRRRDKGSVFPEDGNLRMISLPGAAGVASTYRQPSGSKDANFVSSIIVQFFYEKGGKTDAEHQVKLANFRNIGTKGRFMIKKNGKFEDVVRM